MSWYIKFETFVLCKPGTIQPITFTSREECQRYIDNNCDPHEFPEVEFIKSECAEAVLEYARKGGAR